MSILNYSTQISVEKTVSEIQALLSTAKAKAILTEFDDSGILKSISFRVVTQYGMMSFQLPANVDKIYIVIQRSSKIPKWNRTKEQAARVAWRIIKDWLAAQLALIQSEMATLEQVCLPYATNNHGVPLYETLESSKFNGLTLPAPK